MSNARETVAAPVRIGQRGLLGLGTGLLVAGWVGTEWVARTGGVGPIDPTAAAVGLWAALFGLIAAVAVTACPRSVVFSRPILLWVGLNSVGFAVTGAAVAGWLPPSASLYAYWHVWVGLAVVGFLGTAHFVHRAGGPSVMYLVAGAMEAWVLIVGLVGFQALVPGQYVLLAVVHATPLALDALDPSFDRWYLTVLQVGIYAVTLLSVLLV